ncbi:MarR family transcriptional regulator [Candidatus Saccharibacteria bacterium]|nr:MarR family transcriptional regulator [Candidatus Saccharibacteria bacterium]
MVGGRETLPTTQLSPPLAFQICLDLTRADRNLRATIAAALKPLNLNLMQWLLLGVVETAGDKGMSISAVARTLGVSQSQITILGHQLTATHLLRQKTQRADRRSRHLWLTIKSRAILDDAEAAVSKALKKSYKSAPTNHLVFYHRVLKTIARRSTLPLVY